MFRTTESGALGFYTTCSCSTDTLFWLGCVTIVCLTLLVMTNRLWRGQR